jgi:tRNA(Arg) A34 adenosine deaminase TadA
MSPEISRGRAEQDAPFMTRALELAETAVARGQTPFGAVVVDPQGQPVGEGHNTVRADLDPAAHGRPSAAARSTRAASRAFSALS